MGAQVGVKDELESRHRGNSCGRPSPPRKRNPLSGVPSARAGAWLDKESAPEAAGAVAHNARGHNVRGSEAKAVQALAEMLFYV